jgi:hypothetical protein
LGVGYLAIRLKCANNLHISWRNSYGSQLFIVTA